MAMKRIPRPRDPIARAKLIGDIAAGQVTDAVDDGKNPSAVEQGRLGGLNSGRTRDERLSPERRTEIARKAHGARRAKAP